MTNTLLDSVLEVLKKDSRLVSEEGELLKNKAQELAYKLDPQLISLLLKDKLTKSRFFTVIEGCLIFNQDVFVSFVMSKEFLPDSYTQYKNTIGLTIDGKSLNERKEVSLVWAYKDCVLAGGQDKEDSKRDEIFYNETLGSDQIDRLLDPKVFTEFKRIDKEGKHPLKSFNKDENGDIKDNLIIKGNNLITLHSLKKNYKGKIKLVYADPPYNTGGSTDIFKYNNTFKHSTWMTFMKNRLEIAKELLREDGFLALTIDHEELFYVGIIADEIFGRDNRVGLITIYINPKGRQHEKFFSACTEYMLVYAKNISEAEFNQVAIDEDKAQSFNLKDDEGKFRLEKFIRARTSTLRVNKPSFWYPIYVSQDLKDITLEQKSNYLEILPIENGKEFSWKTKKDTFLNRNKEGYFIAQKNDNGELQIFHKYKEQQVLKNLWTDKRYFSEFNGTNVVKDLLGKNAFSYPKSIYSVIDTLKIMTEEEDIILDFFGGSGTTAHAVLEVGDNRRFIMTEQMDYTNTVTIPRVAEVIRRKGKGDFVYMEIACDAEKYIEIIRDAKNTSALLEIWGEMKSKSFINYKLDPQSIDNTLHAFKALSLDDQKKTVIDMIDKNALYKNLSEMEETENGVSDEDRLLNRDFYNL